MTHKIILAALSDFKPCDNCEKQNVMKVQTWPCPDCQEQGIEEAEERFGGDHERRD